MFILQNGRHKLALLVVQIAKNPVYYPKEVVYHTPSVTNLKIPIMYMSTLCTMFSCGNTDGGGVAGRDCRKKSLHTIVITVQ